MSNLLITSTVPVKGTVKAPVWTVEECCVEVVFILQILLTMLTLQTAVRAKVSVAWEEREEFPLLRGS